MRLGILISGGGTTAEAIIRSTQQGELKDIVHASVVIASNKDAQGIQKAEQAGITTAIVDRSAFSSQETFGSAMLNILHKYKIDFISQNGWLPLTPKNVLAAFDKKVINQHPGPLDPGFPDFGGKGMFGIRVVAARVIYAILINEELPWTEADTHVVTEEFDKGSLLRVVKMPFQKTQRKVQYHDIVENTSVQEYIKNISKHIQQQLLPIEHENVIQTLKELATNTLVPFQRNERVITSGTEDMLTKAKLLAIQLFPNG